MSAKITVTVLADNTVVASDVRGEHGLAFWIDTGADCLLFDAGQGSVLACNAQALRVDLDAVDTIVLSHGHYDHTSGLASVLRQAESPVAVHAHPAALLPKYRRGETGVRDIGMPAECRAALLAEHSRLTLSRRPAEVAPGIWTTGEVLRLHPEEAITEHFCSDPEGREIDLLPDDQALFIETSQGTVVLLGCAHSGLINTLDYVQQLTTGGKPIRAVLGGMHLRSATEDRIAWTIQELRRFNINLLAPLHCTGQKAIAALWAAFPDAWQAVGAGSKFEF
jgi:7,8-dihydropterin-6-yl-methyl-4-(beta-D-ribofuranosyl)aminobenzene 5'-phosphate synthase